MYPFTNLPKSLPYGEAYAFIINKLMAKSIIEKMPIKLKHYLLCLLIQWEENTSTKLD